MRPIRKLNNFVWVCAKLFWRTIYCANLRTELNSQSVSLYLREICRQDLWIIWEYNIMALI